MRCCVRVERDTRSAASELGGKRQRRGVRFPDPEPAAWRREGRRPRVYRFGDRRSRRGYWRVCRARVVEFVAGRGSGGASCGGPEWLHGGRGRMEDRAAAAVERTTLDWLDGPGSRAASR